MEFSLNAGEWNSVFAVPSSIVDRYILLAGENSLKLILFLLRHGGERFTAEKLRLELGFKREGELEDAALFWVDRGIIKAESGELSPASPEQTAVQADKAEEIPAEKPKSSVRKVDSSVGIVYSPADIAERIKSDPAINYLFDEAQSLYGRLLKNPESQLVLSLVDFYGLPADVAALLLKYCFSVGKSSPAYIKSVAQAWVDEGITDAELADKMLVRLERSNSITEKLREGMGLQTKFVKKQLDFIKIWTEEWGFSAEMVLLAHEIAQTNTGNLSFPYMNTILESWHNEGISTAEAAEKRDAEYKDAKRKPAKKSQKDSSSLNMTELEEQIWQKYKTQS